MKYFLTRMYKKLFSKQNSIADLYRKKDYLEAYSLHTDARVVKDPKAAIGGDWEKIGALQFEFLKTQGLQPGKSILDIGCGTLRGGRHFIAYLDENKYTGIDISSKAIEYAKRLIKEENLSNKSPTLLLNASRNLKFKEFIGQKFDYLLAQSVFTHLKEEHIEECFAHVGKVMHGQSRFYFTYFRNDSYKQINLKDFSYPLSLFENMAKKYGFELHDHSSSYHHPKEQNMLSISKKSV